MAPPLSIKGFTSGLALTNAQIIAVLEWIDLYLERSGADTIYADGDLYRSDSFTAIVKRAYDRRRERGLPIKVEMYRIDSADACRDRWAAAGVDVTVHTAADVADWTELGVHALKASGATDALVIGGGKTVLAEFDANELVHFTVFPFKRFDGKGGVHAASLLEHPPHPRLTVLPF